MKMEDLSDVCLEIKVALCLYRGSCHPVRRTDTLEG